MSENSLTRFAAFCLLTALCCSCKHNTDHHDVLGPPPPGIAQGAVSSELTSTHYLVNEPRAAVTRSGGEAAQTSSAHFQAETRMNDSGSETTSSALYSTRPKIR